MKPLIKYLIITGGVALAILALLISIFIFKLSQSIQLPSGNTCVNRNCIFTVKEGSSFASILDKLTDKKIIRHPILFKILYHLQEHKGFIQKGSYLLSPNISHFGLLKLLQEGKVAQFRITLIEGKTFEETLKKLQKEPRIDAKIPQNTSIQALIKLLEIDTDFFQLKNPTTLEGLFLADTYFFTDQYTDIDILKKAHRRLINFISESIDYIDLDSPYKTPYEIVTLASIIEKETGAPHERALIASVFSNRLKQNMRLQSDPTIIYGLRHNYDGRISKKEIKQKTPYNTYRINGLPPSPIALVGPDSISASIQPDQTDYLYFVAKGNGEHYFSRTLKEHNQAVRNYQINRSKDYRSYYKSPA